MIGWSVSPKSGVAQAGSPPVIPIQFPPTIPNPNAKPITKPLPPGTARCPTQPQHYQWEFGHVTEVTVNITQREVCDLPLVPNTPHQVFYFSSPTKCLSNPAIITLQSLSQTPEVTAARSIDPNHTWYPIPNNILIGNIAASPAGTTLCTLVISSIDPSVTADNPLGQLLEDLHTATFIITVIVK
jgi:hypothetical protein